MARASDIGGGEGEGGSGASVSDVDRTSLTVGEASWGLLRTASLYELPRIRLVLLPCAWKLLQQKLPQSADASGKRTRARLAFLHAKVKQPEEDGANADADERMASTTTAADAGADDDGDGGAWAELVGDTSAPSAGGGLPLMGSASWGHIGSQLQLLAALPCEWFPPGDIAWLLPRTLVLAQLAQAAAAPSGRRGDDSGEGEGEDENEDGDSPPMRVLDRKSVV